MPFQLHASLPVSVSVLGRFYQLFGLENESLMATNVVVVVLLLDVVVIRFAIC